MLFGSIPLIALAAIALVEALDATSCCTKLNNAFDGEKKVHFPLSLQYLWQNLYFSRTSYGKPTCIFVPTSIEDVSKAVSLFSQNNCVFAIRSGGHLANPGFQTTNDGILVSLSSLDTVDYDSEKGVVAVGTGNKWKRVYKILDPLKITVMGGRSMNVGVGGFLLGGGISFLSNAYGWGADNVVDYEVVIADGTVVHANSTTNSDLFKALKGGSSNFGIITTFTLKAYPIHAITSGMVMYKPKSTADLIKASAEYLTNVDEDTKSHVIPAIVQWGSKRTPPMGAFTVFYSEEYDINNPPKIVKRFVDGSMPYLYSSVKNQTGISGMAWELGAGHFWGLRNRWHDAAIRVDVSLMQTIYDLFLQDTDDLGFVWGFFHNIAFQPIGKSFIQAGINNGGNSFGITEPIVIVSVNCAWWFAKDDEKVANYMRKLYIHIEEVARAAGKYVDFQYMNYANTYQDPIAGYGNESIAHLSTVKQKFDPGNVFGNLVQGGFKIPGFSSKQLTTNALPSTPISEDAPVPQSQRKIVDPVSVYAYEKEL